MRFVRFLRHDSCPRIGVLHEGSVRELRELAGHPDPLLGLLRDGAGAMTSAARSAATVDESLAGLTLLAPLAGSPKVIGIGLNYESHRLQIGAEPPSEPIVNAKFPSAVIGPRAPIVLPAAAPSRIDFEATLAVIIGASGRNVAAADAMSLVAGYMVANDLTARDWQVNDPQRHSELGKGFGSFLAMGPALVTADEVDDPHDLQVTSEVSGEILQDGNTSDLIFPIPVLIAYLSQVLTLMSGDVILTGTPGGPGMSRTPPRWLGVGNVLRTSVGNLGHLENRVEAAGP
jgi:2-keto-4-pentenoate hydratase/2-oxohepta-3-ene-1,7-dioic acid hydratase in catechol pathway